MANRIYLQIVGAKSIFEAPLIEDVTLELGSGFQTWGDLAPGLTSFLDLIKNIPAATGKISKEMTNIMNLFDVPRWTKTDPIKFQTKLAFYTQTDAKKDVFDKVAYITSLCILTRDPNGVYVIPGANVTHLRNLLDNKEDSKVSSLAWQTQLNAKSSSVPKESDFQSQSKLVSVEIPGIVYLSHAFVMTCTPTFSRQKTEKGYPLWGHVDIQLCGLFPASDQMFKNVEVAVNQVNPVAVTTLTTQQNMRLYGM